MTAIGWRAFEGCSSLQSIVVAKGNPKYDSRERCNAIIETATNKLIFGCPSTIIPESVTEIGGSAFSGCSPLKSITIPESVTEIGGSAFEGCISLQSITIPEGVTEIGERAFIDCTSLQSIVIPKGVKKIEGSAFTGCTALTTVTLPIGVNKIGETAFYVCEALTTIYVPAKKTDYYKQRLPVKLHSLIVELQPEKKAKKK